MKVEFVGQSSRDTDNLAANTSRLVNCYREVSGGRSAYVLKSCLGLTLFCDLPGVFVRALEVIDGVLYAVAGGKLYSIAADGSYSSKGSIDDSEATTIAGNNGYVTVCANGKYYVWDGATLTTPAAGAFSSFGGLEYFGNYTVITEKNGRRFQWSALADAKTLPGLSFSTADGRDDNLLRPFFVNGSLYLFGTDSHEVWYLTGQAGANAFERMAGGVVDTGLKAFGLICRFAGSAFFIGSDNRAHIIGIGSPVSTPAVETAIKQGQASHCVSFEDEGHTFCAIVFRDRPAWVYDIASGEWHERQDVSGYWSVTATAGKSGDWYAGRDDGRVFLMERANMDAGLPMVREAVSKTLYGDGGRFTAHEVELFARAGFIDASLALETSRDNGVTWSAPKVRAMVTGEYARKLNWRALGQFSQMTVRVSWSEAADVTVDAEARVRT